MGRNMDGAEVGWRDGLGYAREGQQGRRQGRWCGVELIVACVLPIECERSGRAIVFVRVQV